MIGNRLWVLGAVLVSIAVVALGWFLGVSPRLDEISSADSQRATVEQQNDLARARIAKLKADYANLDQVAAQLDQLRESLPPSADYQGFLAELNDIAGKRDAKLTSFVPTAPTVFTPASAAPSDATATGDGASALPDGTLVTIPVSLSASGSYPDLLDLMGDLQKANRLYLVGGLNISSADDASTVTVTGDIFVEIDSSVTAPDDAVGGPAPTQSPTPDASGTPAP
ncbi:type 4a pilus biogenesis protein PilO [Galbitalea sp. SE-J8]|uniref:type 4a pilus biogenesis protein PilO n=1 Tax=Galbitalea sp. SE-J8 TaxID=3054952 RepID=UPI00259D2F78|nr:type 4a pilus biogenesis protein PilO [Galbitalea sp. SE-J8]MDM4761515.1 type 4a pilus biogenesis protein PilO [Galbitalea sp. SE-J8]